MIEPRETALLRQVWGVSALLLAAADALAARFGAVAVRGELSGFARAASGHCYFSLKDENGTAALLRCAMFRRAAALLDFAPADGQKVELRGRLEVYEARGELQLVVESMQRVGVGTLYEEFLRLRARLEATGLFDAARKRELPRHPVALGVITSVAAAALHDVLTTLARRAPHLRVVVYPSLVQGAQAPASIVGALATAGARREVDALLLVRGGGSLEDLWAFNDERVVRAIVASPLPVVCGVGHETDVTLADLAADLRAPTPTAAAELAAPATADLRAALGTRETAIARGIERAVAQRAQRLDSLALRLGRPAGTMVALRERLHVAARRLAQSVRPALARRTETVALRGLQLAHVVAATLQRRCAALDALGARLAAEDPARVLARGYAWVEDTDGRPVLSAAALAAGREVRAVWADGQARAEVLEVLTLPPHRR